MKKIVLAVALALAGCATSTQELSLGASPVGLAAPNSAKVEAISIGRWWTLFGDPALERPVDEALAHNADLESAVARVREARATLGVARAAQMPTLDAKARVEPDRAFHL